MRIRLRSIDLHRQPCRTRLPFRFGVATLRAAPYVTLRVQIEAQGATHAGFASDLMVPKWFEKDAAKSLDDDIQTLNDSIAAARDAFLAIDRAATPFELWWDAYQQLVTHEATGLPRGFGIALIERAIIDATCRAAGISFARALADNLLGFCPELVHPQLGNWQLTDSLPAHPLDTIEVRHTIGLADDLRTADRSSRIDDGLPETLEEDIHTYGLRFFKLKLCGQHDADVARLSQVAAVLDACVDGAPELTIDGNEQFDDMSAVRTTLESAATNPLVRKMLAHLLHIEQPLARQRTFDPLALRGIEQLDELAPVIIDEADATVHSFPRALDCGYRGISVKNCKGVFRALLNTGLCAQSDGRAFQCSEDLTNLPILALQQDLATSAALGLSHTERNGHHYFRGLTHLPQHVAEQAIAAHPDLYTSTPWGAGLRIEEGRLQIESLQCTGYGYNVDMRAIFAESA